jgi:DnaK suppressor protein
VDADHARQLLARERSRIEDALEELASDGSGESLDPPVGDDGAADMVETEVDESVVERLREELDAVERAERRLAEGTYGISLDSGEPIPDARLEAIPWAERTAEEQARHEP